MNPYIWQVNISECYNGELTPLKKEIMYKIDQYSNKIKESLQTKTITTTLIKEIFHSEKLINILLMVLDNPHSFFYTSLEECLNDVENIPVDFRDLNKKFIHIQYKPHWIILEAVEWKGDEKFWSNIFGK